MSIDVFAAMEAITTGVLDAAANGEPLAPDALTYLLRTYRATDRIDVGAALGTALADALMRYGDEPTTVGRAGWLRVFADAAAISDDDRLAPAARHLIAELSGAWPSAVAVDEAAASIDACLAAAHLADPRELIPTAVDALERVVGGAYKPGVGVAHTAGAHAHVRGGFADQVRSASALLTAFELTGRLPYSMLAEELMQLSRGDLEAHPDVVLTCEAARVLCRLAALHEDDDYRGAAVIAEAADYRADAGRMLARVSDGAAGRGAAIYGIALGEWSARPDAGGETA